MSIPRPLSEGEELFALHLQTYKIPYKHEVRLVSGRRWKWDFVIADLAIEIHGGTWQKGCHSSGKGILRDASR